MKCAATQGLPRSGYTPGVDYEHEHRDVEHEHRDAEHEHDDEPEYCDADEDLDRPFLTWPESTSRPRSSPLLVHTEADDS